MRSTQRTTLFLDYATLIGRWFLGLLFIQMGLSKALHPVEFLKLAREYDIVTSPLLLNSIVGTLPWFEVFCGILLLLGVAVRGTAVLLISMLVPFTVVVIQRALSIATAKGLAFCAVKFDCGCGSGEVYICSKVLENSALMLLSFWLILGYGRQLSLRYCLFRKPKTLPQATPSPASPLPAVD
jgi:uncharacterized membrane protein YphA (DoxX/SURF4 family)